MLMGMIMCVLTLHGLLQRPGTKGFPDMPGDAMEKKLVIAAAGAIGLLYWWRSSRTGKSSPAKKSLGPLVFLGLVWCPVRGLCVLCAVCCVLCLCGAVILCACARFHVCVCACVRVCVNRMYMCHTTMAKPSNGFVNVCSGFMVGLWWVYGGFMLGLWWVYGGSAVGMKASEWHVVLRAHPNEEEGQERCMRLCHGLNNACRCYTEDAGHVDGRARASRRAGCCPTASCKPWVLPSRQDNPHRFSAPTGATPRARDLKPPTISFPTQSAHATPLGREGTRLYAVNEMQTESTVTAFAIDRHSGGLQRLGSESTVGAARGG